MVSILAYSKIEQDIVELSSVAKELIAKISEDYWEIRQMSSLKKMRDYLSEKPLIHLIIYDICDGESFKFLIEIRKRYPQTRFMILADTSISPMEYIRPDLRISALLLKPWSRKQAYSVLYDFMDEYLESYEKEGSNGIDSYVLETREGKINIPYEQIYFFEAREKKIYVCIGKEEYGFYSSIDKILIELPAFFVRCHRGFIVNTKKIRKIILSQSIIYLKDGFDVPLSRSYKAAFKGKLYERR